MGSAAICGVRGLALREAEADRATIKGRAFFLLLEWRCADAARVARERISDFGKVTRHKPLERKGSATGES